MKASNIYRVRWRREDWNLRRFSTSLHASRRGADAFADKLFRTRGVSPVAECYIEEGAVHWDPPSQIEHEDRTWAQSKRPNVRPNVRAAARPTVSAPTTSRVFEIPPEFR
jgi:hypothetical protein